MTVLPSLQAIASALGGRVVRGRKPHVAAPFPGKKKHDRSLHVFINGDDIGVHVFRDGVDAIEIKDHVRRVCGRPSWQPQRRKPKTVPFAVRNHFFGETLEVCRAKRPITIPMFDLLMNDMRLRGDTRDAIKYAREFGFDVASIERCLPTAPRHYTADERAEILNLTYRERQQLQLRRTGSVDVDKAGRERARRDRYNAKRRAARAAARIPGVNKRSPVEGRSEGKKEERNIHPGKITQMIEPRLEQPVELPKEQPLPAIPHEQLAEMRLLDELGDGDPDRGVRIAIAMGDAKFCALRRELMRGALYPRAIRATVRDRRNAA